MNPDNDTLLEFVINLSVQLARLENKLGKIDLSENEEFNEVKNRVETCIRNDQTLTHFMNQIVQEIKNLKASTPTYTIITKQGEVADGTVDGQGEESHEKHDEDIRKEESETSLLCNDK